MPTKTLTNNILPSVMTPKEIVGELDRYIIEEEMVQE